MIALNLRMSVLAVVGMCLMIPCGTLAQCSPQPTTVVQGTVFLETPDASASVPGPKVTVWGDFVVLTAVADREGKFRFTNLDSGTYTAEATYFDLHAEQRITVEDDTVVEVALLLKLPDPRSAPKSLVDEDALSGENRIEDGR